MCGNIGRLNQIWIQVIKTIMMLYTLVLIITGNSKVVQWPLLNVLYRYIHTFISASMQLLYVVGYPVERVDRKRLNILHYDGDAMKFEFWISHRGEISALYSIIGVRVIISIKMPITWLKSHNNDSLFRYLSYLLLYPTAYIIFVLM